MNNLIEFDLTKPEQALSKYLGFPVKLTATVSSDRMSITSQELKEQTGIMSKLYKTLTLGSHYNTINQYNGFGDCIYFTLHFWYSFNSGGSNGAKVGSLLYVLPTNKWI